MSGSMIGGVVGGVIGSFVPGLGTQLGYAIGSVLGGWVDPVKTQGPRLADASNQTATAGGFIPKVFGTAPVSGNIIWQGPVNEHKKKERAGKGGGPTTTTYTYTRSYAIRICTGPIAGLLIAKRNGKVMLDQRPDADILDELTRSGMGAGEASKRLKEIRAGNSKFSQKYTVYLGTEDQMPDPTIESYKGAGNALAYRGIAYMVADEDETQAGEVAQWEFVVTADGEAHSENIEGGLYPGRVAGFSNQHWPLEGSIDEYEYTGYIGTQQTGGGTLNYSASSPQEIIEYFSSYDYSGVGGGSRNPVVYIGYSATTSSATLPSIGLDITGLGVSAATDQPDVIDNTAVVLVYNDLPYDHINPNNGYSGFCSTGGVIVNRRGAVAQAYSSAPNGQWSLAASCPGNDLYLAYPLCIRVTRKRVGPIPRSDDPDYQPIPDAPGWYLSPDGEVVPDNIYTQESGSYRVLALANTAQVGVLAKYSNYEIGPVERAGSPNYDNEPYWTARYNEAVTSGLLPPGMTYGPTIGLPTTYPRFVSTVWEASSTNVTYIDPDKVVLGQIVAYLCRREGLQAGEYDVSQLTDLVPGFRMASEAGAETYIDTLAQAYFSDWAEYDGCIHFVKRGGDPVATITPDDWVERDDPFEVTLSQDVELLRKLTVRYFDPKAAYTVTTQNWERSIRTIEARGEQTFELPVVLGANAAAQVADKRGRIGWAEREKAKFGLTVKWADLVPTDNVVVIDKSGKANQLRLMQGVEDSGVISTESSSTRQRTYTSNVTGVVPNPRTPPETVIRGPTQFAVMALPVWSGDADDRLGLYVAARGYLSGWQGASILISADGGASYGVSADFDLPCNMGSVTSSLAAWHSPEYPSHQSITVTLPEAPASVSYATLLTYRNMAAVQLASGAWEILQWQTVTDNGGGSYTLGELVRGRFNTAPGAISAGATFVVLDTYVQFVPFERAQLGSSVKVKAVSYGTSADDATAYDVSLTGESQTEWPVTFVQASRDGSDNVAVSWIPRQRLGTEVSPQQSDYFTGYRVSWDDGATVTTADTTAENYTIPSAADPITVTVSALNSITGAGPASEAITV